MELLRHYLSMYVFFLGIILILFSLTELILPDKLYSLQKRWIQHPLFPLHGLLLMIGGFPLLVFRETLSGKIMMGIGLVVVFSGPFILIFPDKMQNIFLHTDKEIEGNRRTLIYIDAIVRFLCGILSLYVMIFNEAILSKIKVLLHL
jgi:hypothetical protein